MLKQTDQHFLCCTESVVYPFWLTYRSLLGYKNAFQCIKNMNLTMSAQQTPCIIISYITDDNIILHS